MRGSATKEREIVGVERGGEVGGGGDDDDSDVSLGSGGGNAGDEIKTEADEAGERMGLAGSGWLEA